MYKTMFLVALGGSMGSVLRWSLGLMLNALYPAIPPGTLISNLIAGYVIGVLLAVFSIYPFIAPEWKLFLITGCMGGLSTFSSFSAEVAMLFQQGKMGLALMAVSAHVVGSVILTLLGMSTVYAVRG